jgi:simple sugar transport system permease protein
MTSVGIDAASIDTSTHRRRITVPAYASDAAWTLGVPLAALVVALLAGAIVIAVEGHSPLDVYRSMYEGVTQSRFGWRDTLTRACPVVLIAIGLSFAYRARVYNIGAEGQLLVGALTATAWATSPGTSLPGPILIATSIVIGAFGGAAWAAIAAWFGNRFGASIVISSLLLVYVAESLLAYAVRVPLKDHRTAALSQSEPLGNAELPVFGDVRIHAGVFLAAAVVPVAWIVLQRARFGFRVRAMGFNRDALEANEVSGARITMWVMLVSGALAGIAGYFQVAGVQGRLTQGISPGFGFTAITVALVGRLHPVGCVLSGIFLSAMLIGAETAQRRYGLPVSLVEMLQALVVVLVVAFDALASRWRRFR